ncbi:tetratricopeptide repeat protein [bacterium]|nr:tetratricopeptide repeat protein [bacterium]
MERTNDSATTEEDDLIGSDFKRLRCELHSNRALCYLKLEDFKRARDAASEALEIDGLHFKSLWRRAKAFDAMKDQKKALRDVIAMLITNQNHRVGNKMRKRLSEGLHERTVETIENTVRGEAMEILRLKELARDELERIRLEKEAEQTTDSSGSSSSSEDEEDEAEREARRRRAKLKRKAARRKARKEARKPDEKTKALLGDCT